MLMALSRRFISLPAVIQRWASGTIAALVLREPDAASGLPAGLADILFDGGLRFQKLVRRAVSYLAPVREADFERGASDGLGDRIQVRLQLLNCQSHISFARTSCGAVSMGLRRARPEAARAARCWPYH